MLVRCRELAASGNAACVQEGERLHADTLPLLTYLMANPQHMLCYGRRLLAMRADVGEGHRRRTCITPHPFGLQMAERRSAGVATLSTPK